MLNVQNDTGIMFFTVTWMIKNTSLFTKCLSSSKPEIPEKNVWMDLIPKNVKNSDFWSVLYSKPLREFRKLKFKIGDRVRISKYDLHFRKGYESQFTQVVFGIVAISSRKPPIFTKKDERDEIICGIFYQQLLIKIVQKWIGLLYSWFLMQLHSFFRCVNSATLRTLCRSIWIW